MKWIGQHIWDFVSRFRNDVYLEDLTELDQEFSVMVDADGKLTKSSHPGERSRIQVRNDEGSTIPAGAPLYSKGEIGGSERILVGIADANDSSKMPCIGVAEFEMNTTDTKDSFAVTQGVYNTNISGFTGLSVGDTLYVNGGVAPHLTQTKPTNGDLIQNVGIVLKTNGTICQGLLVSAIGRTNDVPWPLYVDHTTQRVGIGTSSPLTKLHVSDESTPEVRIQDTTNDRYLSLYQNNSNSYIQTSLNSPLVFSTHGSNERMRITTAGNVGIGTSSPSEKLEVSDGNLIVSNSTSEIVLGTVSGKSRIFTNTSKDIRFSTASTNDVLFLKNSNGNVGIGTTSPAQKLHVDGNIRVGDTADTIYSNRLFPLGNADFTITSYNGYDLLLNPSAGDNVGIGTASPTSKLHVVGDARIQGNLTVNGTYTQIDTDVNTTEQWLVTNDGTGPAAVINQLGTEDIFDVQDDGTSVFYIEDGGNVGIGTTSPTEKLHVNGNGLFNGGLTVGDSAADTFITRGHTYLATAGNNVGIGTTTASDTLTINAPTSSGISINNAAGSLVARLYHGGVVGNEFGRFYLKSLTTSSEVYLAASGSSYINSGNVGIGTSSPSYKLDIDGQTRIQSTNYEMLYLHQADANGGFIKFTNTDDTDGWYTGISGSEEFIISRTADNSAPIITAEQNGNVGIGTSSPDSKLHVYGTSNPVFKVEDDGGAWGFMQAAGSNQVYVGSGPSANLSVYAGLSSAITILASNRNVGIGNTNPGYKLDVSSGSAVGARISTSGFSNLDLVSSRTSGNLGGIRFKQDIDTYQTGEFLGLHGGGFEWKTGNGAALPSTRMILNTSGNVGIGTTSPQADLQVGSVTTSFYSLSTGKADFIDTDKVLSETQMGTLNVTSNSRNAGDNSDLGPSITFSQNVSQYVDGYEKVIGGIKSYITTSGNTGENSSLGFYTHNGSSLSERLTINSSGNVGIGTATPSEKLEVNGNISIPANAFLKTSNNNYNYIELYNGSDASMFFRMGHPTVGRFGFLNNSNTEVFTIDARNENVGIGATSPDEKLEVSGNIKIGDSDTLKIGDGSDFTVTHDGTDTFLGNNTGDLYITQQTDDGNIIFRSDDNSGGVTEYFRLNGADKRVKVQDGVRFVIGTGSDLQLYHNAANSFIENTNGDLTISNLADDKDIIFKSDDGSGGQTEYFRVDGANEQVVFSKNLKLQDNDKLRIGNANDLEISHDSFDTYVNNFTGNLYIVNRADDKDIIFQSDDGSGDVETYFYLDGSVSAGSPFTVFPDSSSLTIGSGFDLRLKHDGSNSYIQQTGVGDLYIQNTVNDRDIIFQSDDGSGGVAEYFRLDGSLADGNNYYTKWPDNSVASFGSAPDLLIYHDGFNSRIRQLTTSNLIIENLGDDKDIIFKCDDGSGGVAEYFKLDGSSAAHDGSSYTALYTTFPDNSLAAFGDSQDLVMYHSGTNSFIRHLGDGHLYIDNTTDDANIYFRSDDGSGGVATYFRLNGSSVETVVSKDMRWEDSVKAKFGAGSDLQIYHDGTDSIIDNLTGNFYIRNQANDKDIIFICDNGSGGTETYFRLDGSSQVTIFSKATSYGDNVKALFGASGDLQIYHDGSNSYIKDGGTGNLRIAGQSVDILNPDATEFKARFKDNAEVELYYDNSKKLETTSTGVEVTGNISLTGSVQKQIQVFPMNFVDDLGTDKHFMPFVTNTEQTVNYQEEAAMVMPADGRVVSVTVHYAQMHGTDGNITVGIETSACGQSYANPWTVEETETIAASVTDDHHVFHFAFDNAKHFESTDKMAISIQQSTDMQSAARFFWVTAVIEYDWSTFLGGTSAEYTTTP